MCTYTLHNTLYIHLYVNAPERVMYSNKKFKDLVVLFNKNISDH